MKHNYQHFYNSHHKWVSGFYIKVLHWTTLALTEVSAYGMLVEPQRLLVRCEKLTAYKTTISYISLTLT